MSLAFVKYPSKSEETRGIIPFVCEYQMGKPLFMVIGGIFNKHDLTGLPTVCGKAYSYNTFPWPEGVKQISEEECRKLAKENKCH